MFGVWKLENYANNGNTSQNEEGVERALSERGREKRDERIGNDVGARYGSNNDWGRFNHIDGDSAKDDAKDAGDANDFATKAELGDGDGEDGKEGEQADAEFFDRKTEQRQK